MSFPVQSASYLVSLFVFSLILYVAVYALNWVAVPKSVHNVVLALVAAVAAGTCGAVYSKLNDKYRTDSEAMGSQKLVPDFKSNKVGGYEF